MHDPEEGKPAVDHLIDNPSASWHLSDISGKTDKVFCGPSCALKGVSDHGLNVNESVKPFSKGIFSDNEGALRWGEREKSVWLKPNTKDDIAGPQWYTDRPCDNCGATVKDAPRKRLG